MGVGLCVCPGKKHLGMSRTHEVGRVRISHILISFFDRDSTLRSLFKDGSHIFIRARSARDLGSREARKQARGSQLMLLIYNKLDCQSQGKGVRTEEEAIMFLFFSPQLPSGELDIIQKVALVSHNLHPASCSITPICLRRSQMYE